MIDDSNGSPSPRLIRIVVLRFCIHVDASSVLSCPFPALFRLSLSITALYLLDIQNSRLTSSFMHCGFYNISHGFMLNLDI